MKRIKYILSVLVILHLVYACQKENTDENISSAVKILPDADGYNARSTFADAAGQTYIASVANENEANSVVYGLKPAVLHKFDSKGNFLWKKNLPGEVYNLWKALLLANGEILCVGMDSTRSSQNMGLVIVSSDGMLIQKSTLFNQFSQVPSSFSQGIMDCIELANGKIALLTKTLIVGGGSTAVPMLYIINNNLELVSNHYYENYRIGSIPSVNENEEGDLLMTFETGVLDSTQTLVAKVVANTFELVEVIEQPLLGNTVCSNICVSNSGDPIWATTESTGRDLNLRNQESYKLNRSISIWKSSGNSTEVESSTISGFPMNGYVSKIRKSSQGGYIALGTCNIFDDRDIPSQYRVLLVKLDGNLNIEWQRDFDAGFVPTVGQDIIEVVGGYQICATISSMNDFNRPVLLRTDYQGNLY